MTLHKLGLTSFVAVAAPWRFKRDVFLCFVLGRVVSGLRAVLLMRGIPQVASIPSWTP